MEILEPGPAIQNDLFEILMRFRKYKFVITADVTKMYRQVLVNDSQKPLQRIIWRFQPHLPFEVGLLWNPKKDILFFMVNFTIKGQTATKRQILSCIAQIFDPLGFITPFATVVKIILQKLWQLKLSWDESIPLDLRTRWVSLRDNISALDEIKIP